MPTRPTVTFRISQTGIDQLIARATEESVERSELIRRLLAYGMWKMPHGWKPPKRGDI